MLRRMSDDTGARFLQNLVNTERPARMVGLFTSRAMKPGEIERLVDVCLTAMREEDQAASLDLAPLGTLSPAELKNQRAWRITVVEFAGAAPHDCLVQVFDMQDPASNHRALLEHIGDLDEELGQSASHLAQHAQTYLSVASGKLDDPARIHPFQNLVALFTSALGAAIVDPGAAIVTTDPGEWADALEMSLNVEKEMAVIHR